MTSLIDSKFSTQSGYLFPGISTLNTVNLRESISGLNISTTHITEAASYSLAMVARFALGLSADRADVCVLANYSLCGAIALATLRHLHNAGSRSKLFIFKGDTSYPNFEKELSILSAMGLESRTIDESNISEEDYAVLTEAISSSHNLILGMFEIGVTKDQKRLINILNEARTPVHCIDCPLGIDPDSGKASETPLFASSTLSLGTVYNGLFNGDTYVGRHYLCDISITKELYNSIGLDLSPLFSEQPVIPIFPEKPKEED